MNTAPILNGKIDDYNLVSTVDSFNFTISPNLFLDPEGSDILYTVVMVPAKNSTTEMPLPSWISYNPATSKLSGFSNQNLQQYFRIKADD